MKHEIWKKHPKLDIEVSNFGGVRTVPRDIMTKRGIRHYNGKVLGQFIQKLSKSRTCYKQVSISPTPMEYKKFWVHRLVAEVWIPNPNGYKQVNHIDGDGLNNRADNLEWCDQSYNMRHAINMGNYKGVKYINGKSMAQISRELGDKRGQLVWNRINSGWCVNCATTIPYSGIGGDRTRTLCPHKK